MEGILDAETARAAVLKDGRVLESVPESLRTPELCLLAVRRHGSALRFVPRGLRLPDICLAAVLAGGDDVIFAVPERHRTEAMCLLSCDPARWSVPGMACRRTAEALPRCFFRKDGVLKQDLADFFGAREHGREMLLRMQGEDGRFRRLRRRSWREDLVLEGSPKKWQGMDELNARETVWSRPVCH